MSPTMRRGRERLATAAVAVSGTAVGAAVVTTSVVTFAVVTFALTAAVAAFVVAVVTAVVTAVADAVGSGTVAVVAACVTTLALIVHRRHLSRAESIEAYDGRRSPRPSRAITGASRLLPADVRDEYREEWAGWLLDLRAGGAPRTRWWIELLSIVFIAAPRLAVILRSAAYRKVDR
ncbi:hypothetical protein ACQPZF_35390 [Actinosynnema sp. CS-041913]|uniref:hypothetical protein n=1 Tax=Actinosynnema sp. CS-041913 TaxID=3239917 RepID=UPI003D93BE0A